MPNDTEDRIRRGQFEDIYRSRVASGARNAQTMTPEDIVEEISSLRETMNLAAQRVIELSRVLYAQVRRGGANSTTPAYLAYANGWTRLAAAVQQGLRRTSTTDRVLSSAQRQHAELEPRPSMPQAQPKADRPVRVDPLHNPNPLKGDDKPLEDFMKLYGKEIVRGAR
jgi:hypothetical protein